MTYKQYRSILANIKSEMILCKREFRELGQLNLELSSRFKWAEIEELLSYRAKLVRWWHQSRIGAAPQAPKFLM